MQKFFFMAKKIHHFPDTGIFKFPFSISFDIERQYTKENKKPKTKTENCKRLKQQNGPYKNAMYSWEKNKSLKNVISTQILNKKLFLISNTIKNEICKNLTKNSYILFNINRISFFPDPRIFKLLFFVSLKKKGSTRANKTPGS
jgi:hypothetical protein